MCLLIVKPEGESLPDLLDTCEDAHATNPDGFGVAYLTRRHGITILRGLINPRKQAEVIRRIGAAPAMLHWRLGTGGGISKVNCHPFRIQDGSALAHNGILPIQPTRRKSDTRLLAECAIDAQDLREMLADLTSARNKFALFDASTQEIEIHGEEHGTWEDGIWYSNTYWRWTNSVCLPYWKANDDNPKEKRWWEK